MTNALCAGVPTALAASATSTACPIRSPISSLNNFAAAAIRRRFIGSPRGSDPDEKTDRGSVPIRSAVTARSIAFDCTQTNEAEKTIEALSPFYLIAPTIPGTLPQVEQRRKSGVDASYSAWTSSPRKGGHAPAHASGSPHGVQFVYLLASECVEREVTKAAIVEAHYRTTAGDHNNTSSQKRPKARVCQPANVVTIYTPGLALRVDRRFPPVSSRLTSGDRPNLAPTPPLDYSVNSLLPLPAASLTTAKALGASRGRKRTQTAGVFGGPTLGVLA
jgi:hypothetical protein